MIEIKSLLGSVLHRSEKGTLREALEEAVAAGASLDRASLDGAYLAGASLDGASLDGAYLDGASLDRASLDGASLDGASLDGASLRNASLSGASLDGASLDRASLDGAYLDGAKGLDTCVLETGETFAVYLKEVVPALCVAGGKTLAEVAAGWNCHAWDNCPMAIAFDVHEMSDIPALYRPRVEQFIRMFDQKLIPCPVEGAAACEVKP